MRLIFHSNFIHEQHDWTPEAILEREESWLYGNGRDDFLNNNNSINFAMYHRNTIYGSYLLRSSLNNSFLNRVENNRKFFLGLLIGTICNIYTIFILLLFNFRPKFKIGLQLGMLFGTFIVIIYSLIFRK
jgi:hypothetical protein